MLYAATGIKQKDGSQTS